MPLWTSFTLNPALMETSINAEWSSDVRLDESNTIKCDDYYQLEVQENTTMAPLFSPGELFVCVYYLQWNILF